MLVEILFVLTVVSAGIVGVIACVNPTLEHDIAPMGIFAYIVISAALLWVGAPAYMVIVSLLLAISLIFVPVSAKALSALDEAEER